MGILIWIISGVIILVLGSVFPIFLSPFYQMWDMINTNDITRNMTIVIIVGVFIRWYVNDFEPTSTKLILFLLVVLLGFLCFIWYFSNS